MRHWSISAVSCARPPRARGEACKAGIHRTRADPASGSPLSQCYCRLVSLLTIPCGALPNHHTGITSAADPNAVAAAPNRPGAAVGPNRHAAAAGGSEVAAGPSQVVADGSSAAAAGHDAARSRPTGSAASRDRRHNPPSLPDQARKPLGGRRKAKTEGAGQGSCRRPSGPERRQVRQQE
jgi:hypothetical protein